MARQRPRVVFGGFRAGVQGPNDAADEAFRGHQLVRNALIELQLTNILESPVSPLRGLQFLQNDWHAANQTDPACGIFSDVLGGISGGDSEPPGYYL
jgi:hypothetical protein